MTNDQVDTQPPLPGLELQGELQGSVGTLRSAVVATLEALKRDGLLEERHTAAAQLALEMADAVQVGLRSKRASAAAMAAAQYLAALDHLPQPVAADVAERFVLLVERLGQVK